MRLHFLSALKFVSFFGAMLSYSGCIHYSPKPLSHESARASFEKRSLSSLGLSGGALSFEKLSRAVLKSHPDVAVARAAADEAKAALVTAGARPNPTVSFNPTRVTPQEAGLSPWVAGFSLDVPVETAGKRARRLDVAQSSANAAALHVSDAAWQVRSKLRKAWIDLFAAERRAETLRAQLATQGDTVKALETRVSGGESSRPELMQSRLLMNQTRLLVSGAEKSAAEARADVAAAMALPVSQITGVKFDFSAAEKPVGEFSAKKLRAAAFTQRSDILASLADYATAEATLRLEVAKQYPDIHLGPGYEFDQGPNKWSLGLSLTLPVFDRNRGPIAEAEAKRESAAAKFHALEAKVSGEIDRALASYRGALAKLKTADELVAETKKQHDSAEALLKGGEGDRLAVLTAQVERDAAALGHLDAQIEVLQAIAAIEDASQIPLAR